MTNLEKIKTLGRWAKWDEQYKVWYRRSPKVELGIPYDFLGDLNAIAELESMLSSEGRFEYRQYLCKRLEEELINLPEALDLVDLLAFKAEYRIDGLLIFLNPQWRRKTLLPTTGPLPKDPSAN